MNKIIKLLLVIFTILVTLSSCNLDKERLEQSNKIKLELANLQKKKSILVSEISNLEERSKSLTYVKENRPPKYIIKLAEYEFKPLAVEKAKALGGDDYNGDCTLADIFNELTMVKENDNNKESNIGFKFSSN